MAARRAGVDDRGCEHAVAMIQQTEINAKEAVWPRRLDIEQDVHP